MFIFGLFLGNPHLKNEKKSQSADNKQNFEILVPLRAKHLKPHNNRLVSRNDSNVFKTPYIGILGNVIAARI